MRSRPLIPLAFATLLLASPAAAEELPIAEDKLVVLACLEQMEITTTWPQCLNLMFEPCAEEVPGSDEHATCLTGVRDAWRGSAKTLQEEVMSRVTTEGANQVLNLIVIWSDFVTQKCEEVAQSRPEGAESARLGCEVSEIAGLTDEFAACLEGRSTAEYCEIEG
ncbi:MAG: hypothetical protein AAF672_12995 [Pseudomonadota bacterium]